MDLLRFGRGNRFSRRCLLDEFFATDLTGLRRFERVLPLALKPG